MKKIHYLFAVAGMVWATISYAQSPYATKEFAWSCIKSGNGYPYCSNMCLTTLGESTTGNPIAPWNDAGIPPSSQLVNTCNQIFTSIKQELLERLSGGYPMERYERCMAVIPAPGVSYCQGLALGIENLDLN